MGIAVALKLKVYCYVQPHDDAEKWGSTIHYRSMQLIGSAALSKKPCIYLVIRGGHFKALSAMSKPPAAQYAHSVLDLFNKDLDPATRKCVSCDSLCAPPACDCNDCVVCVIKLSNFRPCIAAQRPRASAFNL